MRIRLSLVQLRERIARGQDHGTDGAGSVRYSSGSDSSPLPRRPPVLVWLGFLLRFVPSPGAVDGLPGQPFRGRRWRRRASLRASDCRRAPSSAARWNSIHAPVARDEFDRLRLSSLKPAEACALSVRSAAALTSRIGGIWLASTSIMSVSERLAARSKKLSGVNRHGLPGSSRRVLPLERVDCALHDVLPPATGRGLEVVQFQRDRLPGAPARDSPATGAMPWNQPIS